jgi:hypothetical protein
MVLSFAENAAIDVGLIKDLYALLEAIDDVMPSDSVLFLEAGSATADIVQFLETHHQSTPHTVKRGTIFPRSRVYHLPLSSGHLTELRRLADQHAEPEVCDHLAVFHGDRLLLTAYDAGFGHVEIIRTMPSEVIDRFTALAQK